MDKLLQFLKNNINFIIPFATALIGLFLGRYWTKNDKRSAKDLETLKSLESKMRPSFVKGLKDTTFDGEIEPSYFIPFGNIMDMKDDPSFFFLHPKLEKQRKKLIIAIDSFLQLYYQDKTDISDGMGSFMHGKFTKQSELTCLSNKIYKIYTSLIQGAKRIL